MIRDSHSPHAIKVARRCAALANCDPVTRRLHDPIVDEDDVRGHLNPAGFGQAEEFSTRATGRGQSAVAFATMAEYEEADRVGHAPYEGAEYAVVQSPEADAICRKMSNSHGGAGAIILPSGLMAITATLYAFSARSIAIPDNVYSPLIRDVTDTNKRNKSAYLKLATAYYSLEWLEEHFALTQEIKLFRYPSGASATEVEEILDRAESQRAPVDMLYLEAPGSQTFEIPDINGIVKLAQARGIRSVMDNTWGSHVRFKPLEAGIDVVIQATTKYEGGYYDTPSGVAIAANRADAEELQKVSRYKGWGAIDPGRCMRLYHRLDSTEERMDHHYETAQQLMAWFAEQDFVEDILCPARPASPYHDRFKEYFGKGNGLFTVVLKDTVTEDQARDFIDTMNLFRIYESWGGHISGALMAHPHRELSTRPKGPMVRFHAGLEDVRDLRRDMAQAAKLVFVA